MNSIRWPLMRDNITTADLRSVIRFLQRGCPVLTQSGHVRAFEQAWSEWLGVKHSVFVNSGSSANFITMAIIRHLFGAGEIIVPPLTWVSDIASVLAAGHKPLFVDIDPRTLGMDADRVLKKISRKTKAVFLTHVLGFNALSDKLLQGLKAARVPLIEDACESHGASFKGRKVGTFGLVSNFSFYFAHHMSTIEGGMICTNDDEIYQLARMLRSHGMVREADSEEYRRGWERRHGDLDPKFIFAYPSCNYRSTEINAVIGLSQLRRLDQNNTKRVENFRLFLSNLDPEKYRTDFALEGSVNYAFVLILRKANARLRDAVIKLLNDNGVEYRRGTSGGGNQLRQPYLKGIVPRGHWKLFPEVEHVHFYGFYIGNYPGLGRKQIIDLCHELNSLRGE